MLSIRRSAVLLLVGLRLVSFSVSAFAQEADQISLVLEPHCSSEDKTECPAFEVLDAQHLATGSMRAGDILDIDIVLLHGKGKGMTTVRSWLSYDPDSLDVRNVSLSPVLAEPIPGEQSADPAQKVVKIGGDTTEIRSDREVIARVTFQVKTSAKNSVISFSNYREDGMGQTAVRGESRLNDKNGGLPPPPCLDELICRKEIVSLLKVEPSALAVLVESTMESIPDSLIASAQTIENTEPIVIPVLGSTDPAPSQPEAILGNGPSSFSLLQVQNLRVTSRDSSIFLGWQPLKSSALAGYNVYYSTVSGRYIRRRSIPAESSSLVIRDLDPGTTTFIAVRGYNAENKETVFSQEVSVTVGDPESSTAPLIAELMETQPAPENLVENRGGKEINGESGVSSTFFILALVCALIGTMFAAHRQYNLIRCPS